MPARLRKKNQFFEGDQKKAKNKAESSSEELTEPEETPTKKMPLRTTPRSIKHKISATKASASKKIKQEKEDSSDHEEDDIEDEPKDDDSDFEAEIIKPSAKKVVKPKKLSKASLSKSLNATQASEAEKLPPIDKKACQRVGLRLRNLLKLPKAHKFVMYEFFYSTIDQPLLFGGSDFEMCLRQTFPNLKSRMMTRTEWNKVRSVLGKPRRMSNKVGSISSFYNLHINHLLLIILVLC